MGPQARGRVGAGCIFVTLCLTLRAFRVTPEYSAFPGSDMTKRRKKRDKRDKRERKRPNAPPMADTADRHALYEAAVQNVESEIDFVDDRYRTMRGKRAVRLREDFCGTANTSCEWIRRRKDNVAIGVDLDTEVLDWGRRHHVLALTPSQRARLTLLEADVTTVETPPQDIVLAMNFSYWIFKERSALRAYFRRVHAALAPGGVYFLDCYGGYDAFRVMKERTDHDDFSYIWDQAAYNPVNGHMRCHIHFRFPDGSRMKKAFTYDWRLWTLPEVRGILEEAGFARTTVYWQGWDEDEEEGTGDFEPVETADADAGWICYISAEK